MSGRWKTCVSAMGVSLLTALSSLSPAAAQNQHDMTFHTVPPCTVVDTRFGGGAFAVNEVRSYNVVGSASFAAQGGSTTGCAVPGFSSGIPQVQAVELVVTSINAAGAGYVSANAADQPLVGAVLNPLTGGVISNTGAVAVAQTSGSGDIKVLSASTTMDILIRVVGYYSKPVQTVYVHPVPGNNTASGTALRDTVNALTGTSTKHYVVKVEPGIYDVGTTSLTMKPYVDIEGSGEQATVIQGPGAAASTTAVVYGASFADLRNLQIKSTASSTDVVAVALLLVSATDMHLSHVTVTASGPSTSNPIGLRLVGSNPVINDTTVNISGGGDAMGIVSKAFSAPKIHNTHISVSGNTATGYGILVNNAGTAPEMDGLHVEVSGGATSYGYYQDSGFPPAAITGSKFFVTGASGVATGVSYGGSDLRISRSTLVASGGTSYGLSGNIVSVDNSEITGATATVNSFNAILVGSTKLSGGAVAGFVTCAGVWDESYVFSASTCP